ncbi:RTA1-domain-containing protein [Mollisia scopiformis]|uniref:RTA1-domain-containing protein n=1 Tax=Mollisia scopiformis TaxID=149040 RepID=A0A194WZ25_MOLSC|nr:RTA1-domain-containing protein [Mollisia scopiformis]KUJ13210.1 RTA1-domain-containing protein [Mollisia scopiformis]
MTSTISSTASTTVASATATCTTAVPDKNGYVDPSACNALYEYYPSFGAAVLFSFLFSTVTALHIFQAAKFHKKFCWVIIMGCIWEAASFILRTISTKHQQNTNLYTYSFLLVLLAPLLINAFDYMILGRMVHFFLPSKSLLHIPGSRFSRYFVWLDIIAFLVQLGGGMIVSGTNVKPSTFHLGIHIYMGGIGLQQFFICVFTGLAIMFHREMLKLERSGQFVEKGWKRLLFTLYGSLALITLRIIYRLVEYARGEDPSNPLPYHEAFFYCLDATPMFIAVTIMCITHPGTILKGENAEFPKMSRKEKKAEKQRKKQMKAVAKLLDPEGGLMDGAHEMERPTTPTPGAGYGEVAGAERYEPYCGYGAQEEGYGMGPMPPRSLA